jgi:uncharacterized membrane protein YoaK (UPF0700 family)
MNLSLLLSFIAGYVDTAGFLALHGLFTAHVTGNFVTLGAALVYGTSGAVGKLLALPVFCIVVAFVRVLGTWLTAQRRPELALLLGVQTALLAAGAGFALAFGPFADGDSASALLTGLTLVAAMAVQNGVHRLFLGTLPPATLMTGNTTQLVIDLVDWLRGAAADTTPALRQRLQRLAGSVLSFAFGCAVAAGAFFVAPKACFLLPPCLALAAVFAAAATRQVVKP